MKIRQAQHRAESEESKRNKINAEVKRENQKLRREVARLQKEVERLKAYEPAEWADVEPKPVKEPKKAPNGCPKCFAGWRIIQLPTGTLKVCAGCGHKEKVVGRNAQAA